MALPDMPMPEDYTEAEMAEVVALAEKDKSQLTKHQKAAYARFNVKKGKGEAIKFREPGAAPAPAPEAATAAPAAGGGADVVSLLPPEMQALARRDPASLTKEERIALAKAKSQAVKAQAAAKPAAGAAPAAAAPGAPAKPKEKGADDVAREKALTFRTVQDLRKRFPGAIEDVGMQAMKVPFVVVKPERVLEVLRAVRDEGTYRHFANLTAADYPPDRFEVVYNLHSYEIKAPFAVKVKLPRELETGELPSVPSATSLWKGAEWQEREVYDMFGILFEGHPYLKRLLLPEGWIGHPLRKDYEVTKEQFVAIDRFGNDLVSFREEDGW